jgi:hypothetical protein
MRKYYVVINETNITWSSMLNQALWNWDIDQSYLKTLTESYLKLAFVEGENVPVTL